MSSISPFVEKTQIEIRVHKIERPRDRVIPDRSTLSRPSTRWQVSRKDPMVNSSHPDGFPSPMKFRSSVWYHPDANFVSFLIIPYNHEGFSVLELDWYSTGRYVTVDTCQRPELSGFFDASHRIDSENHSPPTCAANDDRLEGENRGRDVEGLLRETKAAMRLVWIGTAPWWKLVERVSWQSRCSTGCADVSGDQYLATVTYNVGEGLGIVTLNLELLRNLLLVMNAWIDGLYNGWRFVIS